DFGGKTSIFSHPVYLFLREFSLQDFRGGSHLAFHNEITGFLIAYTTTNAGKITERSGLLFESIFAVR
ncbi:hypothetical protein ACU2P5_004691, partial [Escherichia coli]